MSKGMIVAVLSIVTAVLAAGVVALIFEGGGGYVSQGNRIFELILMLVVFGVVVHSGWKLAERIDRKGKK